MIACASPDDNSERITPWEVDDREVEKLFDIWNQEFLKRQKELDKQKENE